MDINSTDQAREATCTGRYAVHAPSTPEPQVHLTSDETKPGAYQMGRAGANALHIVVRNAVLCTPDQNLVHRRAQVTVSKTTYRTLAEIAVPFAAADRPCKRCLADVVRAAAE